MLWPSLIKSIHTKNPQSPQSPLPSFTCFQEQLFTVPTTQKRCIIIMIFFFQNSQIGSELEGLGIETPTPARRRIPGSSATSGTKIRDSRVDSGSVDLETPLELSPKSPLEVLDEALSSVISSTSPIPPPRTRLPTASTSR